jgi:hypothetical protein
VYSKDCCMVFYESLKICYCFISYLFEKDYFKWEGLAAKVIIDCLVLNCYSLYKEELVQGWRSEWDCRLMNGNSASLHTSKDRCSLEGCRGFSVAVRVDNSMQISCIVCAYWEYANCLKQKNLYQIIWTFQYQVAWISW